MQFCPVENEDDREYHDYAQKIVGNVVHGQRKRQTAHGHLTDFKPDMTEAHENHGIAPDVFQHTAECRKGMNFIKPTEKVHPQQHCNACVEVCHRDYTPFAVAYIGNGTELNGDIVQYGEYDKNKHL